MKILIPFLAFLILISCKKSEEEVDISGTWNWIQSEGGISGSKETPANTGQTRKLVLTETVITFSTNDSVTLTSSYSRAFETSVYGGLTDQLHLSDSMKFTYLLNSGNLTLKQEANDGISSLYEKVK